MVSPFRKQDDFTIMWIVIAGVERRGACKSKHGLAKGDILVFSKGFLLQDLGGYKKASQA